MIQERDARMEALRVARLLETRRQLHAALNAFESLSASSRQPIEKLTSVLSAFGAHGLMSELGGEPVAEDLVLSRRAQAAIGMTSVLNVCGEDVDTPDREARLAEAVSGFESVGQAFWAGHKESLVVLDKVMRMISSTAANLGKTALLTAPFARPHTRSSRTHRGPKASGSGF